VLTKLTHYTYCECDVQSGHRQVVQFLHQSSIPPNILKKLPLSGSSFFFTYIRDSIILHPSIPAFESKSIMYFCDRRMPFLNLTASMLKYFKDSRSLVWKCESAFASTSPGCQSLVLSPVITISFTYTTRRILFPSCIRQNTEWSFSVWQTKLLNY